MTGHPDAPPRRATGADGFSLIELMVVVLIIGILLAVGIPTLLGSQQRAGDRAAQADLRTALAAVRVVATVDDGDLTGVTTASLDAEGTAITYGAAGTTDVVGVTKSADPDDAVFLFTASGRGTVFGIATSRTGRIGFCSFTDGASAAAVEIDAALSGCSDDTW